jgi:cardiolipin synthase
MSYVEQVTQSGVKMYEHQAGFMHQKVILIDDNVSTIGTANLDNRSFRLNFEISVLTLDRAFAEEVEAMLAKDFADSQLLSAESLAKRSRLYRASTRIARLFSPVL